MYYLYLVTPICFQNSQNMKISKSTSYSYPKWSKLLLTKHINTSILKSTPFMQNFCLHLFNIHLQHSQNMKISTSTCYTQNELNCSSLSTSILKSTPANATSLLTPINIHLQNWQKYENISTSYSYPKWSKPLLTQHIHPRIHTSHTTSSLTPVNVHSLITQSSKHNLIHVFYIIIDRWQGQVDVTLGFDWELDGGAVESSEWIGVAWCSICGVS